MRTKARPGGIDAVEERTLARRGRRLVDARPLPPQMIENRALALGRAESLRLVLRAALARDLGVRAAQQRRKLPDVEAQRRARWIESRGPIELERRP